jgi:NADP-dependent 3-hydroxy acid dehydrogenase YdfG
MSLTIDFSDRTVVVIGGTSGINRGVAELFAQHGARVAVASRSDDKVKATVASLQALGADATGFCADVRDLEAIASLATSTCWFRVPPATSRPPSTACRPMPFAAWWKST